jgi:acyl dehydratase
MSDVSAADRLPRTLAPFRGRLPPELGTAAVACLGERAAPVAALHDAGFVPPDVLTGMTLLLLASQPRVRRAPGEDRKPIEGGVWVREQVTYHAPVRLDEELVVSGEAARQFARRGRRYGVTRSETRDGAGRLLVSSCTTGLLSYRKDASLEDGEEGIPEALLSVSGADPTVAAANPHLERLRDVREGDVVETGPIRVTLAMMQRRDAGRDENRIHTDPEVARREGLAAPIAGGSHVLAFLQAALMEAWGREALLHGAHFDVRWVGQTRAGSAITPRVTVVRASPDGLECDLQIAGEERLVLRGTLHVPLGAR